MVIIKENINMALFKRYLVFNANIIVQTGEISNETTTVNKRRLNPHFDHRAYGRPIQAMIWVFGCNHNLCLYVQG